jgi:hypothetical protein
MNIAIRYIMPLYGHFAAPPFLGLRVGQYATKDVKGRANLDQLMPGKTSIYHLMLFFKKRRNDHLFISYMVYRTNLTLGLSLTSRVRMLKKWFIGLGD